MEKSRQANYNRLLQRVLREARTDAGLTQEEVAVRLGFPQSFVSKYETGERRLNLGELRDICEVLGVSLLDVVRKIETGAL